MSEPFETFDHAGSTIELHPDYDPVSPADWDNLGRLAWFGRGQGFHGTEDAPGDALDAYDRGGCALLVRYLRLCHGQTAVPFQFQDYGSNGARILALDDDDDARAHGYIYADAASIAMTGVAADDVRAGLVVELEIWDDYAQGNVAGYVVRYNGETVDSLWGYYPDDVGDGLENLRDEARAAAEAEQDERQRAANQDVATA
jgi:hypothetical protein